MRRLAGLCDGAKVHNFKVKMLVSRLGIGAFGDICAYCRFLDKNPRFLYLSLLPSCHFHLLKACSANTYVLLQQQRRRGALKPLFKVHSSLKRENSLGASAELIAPAARLIGVRLNLFQVADIISLIPGITRRLKPPSSAKADQPLLTGCISSLRTYVEHK